MTEIVVTPEEFVYNIPTGDADMVVINTTTDCAIQAEYRIPAVFNEEGILDEAATRTLVENFIEREIREIGFKSMIGL